MKRFYLTAKILATILLIGVGFAHSVEHPGYLDALGGAGLGITMFVMWFSKEKE